MTQTKAGLLAGTPSLALYILMSLDLEGSKTVAATCTHSHGSAVTSRLYAVSRNDIHGDEIEQIVCADHAQVAVITWLTNVRATGATRPMVRARSTARHGSTKTARS